MILIHVNLHRPEFHGLRNDQTVDWPPSPVRLVGALMHGAYNLPQDARRDALAAIQQIIESPQPIVVAPQHVDLRVPDTYADRTAQPAKSKVTGKDLERITSFSHFGMDSTNRVAKPMGTVALAGHTVTFVVEVSLSPLQLKALESAAQLIPYFGRSQDPAEVSVEEATGGGVVPKGLPASAAGPDSVAWYPVRDSSGPSRGWAPTTREWFDANYQRTMGADPVIASLPTIPADGYVTPVRYERSLQTESSTMRVLALEFSLDQWLVPRVMKSLAGAIPDGWALLPLTLNNSRYHEGRLAGIGLYPTSSDTLSEPAPLAMQNLVETLHTATATLPAGPRVRHPRALNPGHWTVPAHTWVSTTPLRAFPDSRVLGYQVAQQCNALFGLTPKITRATSEPHQSVEHRWPTSDYTDGNGLWWLTLEFPAAVAGPVVLGCSIEDGFGVFRPADQLTAGGSQ